ncbi:MAG: hypothetical protein AAFV53_26170 [Myxococcota bacterium]
MSAAQTARIWSALHDLTVAVYGRPPRPEDTAEGWDAQLYTDAVNCIQELGSEIERLKDEEKRLVAGINERDETIDSLKYRVSALEDALKKKGGEE